jgi:undecaprenyl diphosphate synthase
VVKNIKLTLPKGTKIPNHIALIPDGNRRWARSKNLYTLEGHKAGFDRAVQLAKAARDLGVHTVTLWGFSTENWDRSEEEINYLMKLYSKLLKDYLKDAHEDKVRLIHLGRKDRLPKFLIREIQNAEDETKKYTKYIANIALDYGGQDEILRTVKNIIKDDIPADKIDARLFDNYSDLYKQPYPNVDLMIRTSGEQRTSGFMLWHSAYTEYYWENGHFPDFTPEKLKEAILDYSRRRRRFGGNDEEKHFKFSPELAAKFEINWWRLRNIPEGMKLREYAILHLKEQFGLSASLAREAAKLFVEAILEERKSKFDKAKGKMKLFYKLVKSELKLAFEPEMVASLEVRLDKELGDKSEVKEAFQAEETARELYAEVYRISIFQAAKLAHLRILASIERNLAEKGMGDYHWAKAEDYLQKFYSALKERVA